MRRWQRATQLRRALRRLVRVIAPTRSHRPVRCSPPDQTPATGPSGRLSWGFPSLQRSLVVRRVWTGGCHPSAHVALACRVGTGLQGSCGPPARCLPRRLAPPRRRPCLACLLASASQDVLSVGRACRRIADPGRVMRRRFSHTGVPLPASRADSLVRSASAMDQTRRRSWDRCSSQLCSRRGWAGLSAFPGPHAFWPPTVPTCFGRGTTDISRASARLHACALESRCVQGRPLGFWAWPAGDPSSSRVPTNRCCLELCLLQGCGHRTGALCADRTVQSPAWSVRAIGSRPPLPAPIRSWVSRRPPVAGLPHSLRLWTFDRRDAPIGAATDVPSAC